MNIDDMTTEQLQEQYRRTQERMARYRQSQQQQAKPQQQQPQAQPAQVETANVEQKKNPKPFTLTLCTILTYIGAVAAILGLILSVLEASMSGPGMLEHRFELYWGRLGYSVLAYILCRIWGAILDLKNRD